MKEEIYYIDPNNEYKDILQLQICGITYPDKNYIISRPNSAVACIEYIEEGTGCVNVGKQRFFPCEGDSYFLHSGLNHYYYSDKENPWKKYFINVSGSLIASLIDGYNLNNKYHFIGLDTKEELLQIIEIAKDRTRDHYPEIIDVLNKIFLKMYHSTKNTSPKTIAHEMKDYLDSHVMEKFKLDDLCKYVSKSESHAIRLFKTKYGITPYSYILNKKISVAKGMLKNTNLPIKQIALDLNFADEYYFSNVFKQKTGETPARFRRISNNSS